MAELILILVFAAIYFIVKANLEYKLDHYDLSKIDTSKLTHDAINGVSVQERRRRTVNGYYDKK